MSFLIVTWQNDTFKPSVSHDFVWFLYYKQDRLTLIISPSFPTTKNSFVLNVHYFPSFCPVCPE
jgi:hypothetical protein